MGQLIDTASSAPLEPLWACVAFGACAALAICIARKRRSAKPATLIWAGIFCAAAAFFAAWSAQGLCHIAPSTFCLYQMLVFLLGVGVLQRDRAKSALDAMANSESKTRRRVAIAFSWARDAAIVLISTLFSFLALEIADNPEWRLIDSSLSNQGMLIVGLSLACLYFLGQRRGALCIAVPVVCGVFGLVQAFLDLFKNTALLPSDVMAWQTAAAVSGGYTYTLPPLAISSIMCALIAVAALAFITPIKAPSQHGIASQKERLHPAAGQIARVAANLACCVLCAYGVWHGTFGIDYQKDLDIELDYWDLRNSYHENGFLISFITAVQDLVIDEPSGYSDESARQLQDRLARQYDEQRGNARAKAVKSFKDNPPSVIAIMNESYADLSVFEELHDGYAGTFVTRELPQEAVETGLLNMSVHGGGTCNSEYEFLAMSSMAFMGSGMYPYQQFNFAHIATIPSIFKQLGYETWAMHPNYPGNWSREFVYATMGFDTSLFIYDFEGAEEYHTFVSDRATYDKALDILRNTDGTQFILDITMQNHSGYDTGSISEDQLTSVHPDFLDDESTAVLNEYLSCIRASDDAVKYLIEQLKKLEKPVAVVFFGDHQPSMSRDYNDALFADEDELAHKARITIAPYFIWTNYDTGYDREESENTSPASNALAVSSANFLGAQLLEAIGAPLDDYQKALLVLHEQIQAVNTNGYCDAKGIWHDASDGTAEDHPYHQLQVLHYLNIVRNL